MTAALIVAAQRVLDAALGFVLFLAGLVAALTAPFAVAAGWRWRSVLRTDELTVTAPSVRFTVAVERSFLPRWLWWYQTPDEPLPGALYEQTIVGRLLLRGPFVTSALWLVRNAGYGLAFACGRPADAYLDAAPGLVVRGRLWRYQAKLGPLVVMVGWKVHRATPAPTPLRAVPFFTARLRRNA